MEDGLRKLIECEKSAQERLEEEMRHQEVMRMQAKRDSRAEIESFSLEKARELIEKEKEVEMKIKELEESVRKEINRRIVELNKRDISGMVDEIVRLVSISSE
jgi:hypothetical protein